MQVTFQQTVKVTSHDVHVTSSYRSIKKINPHIKYFLLSFFESFSSYTKSSFLPFNPRNTFWDFCLVCFFLFFIYVLQL